MATNQEIALAATRLSETDLAAELERTTQVAAVLAPHLEDICVLISASAEIARLFQGLPENRYRDYEPGQLSEQLCRRFSELPQYAGASVNVQRMVSQLGYADVIGIFQAIGSRRQNFHLQGVGPNKWEEFLDWSERVRNEEGIHPNAREVVAFDVFAKLVKQITWDVGYESFVALRHNLRSCLAEEPILASDCERLVQMGIKRTPDLAQTSVDVLAAAFADDPFALGRLHAYLQKRGLAFGIKFLPQWG